MPAQNLKAAISDAAKRIADPSSPRKSARDLFRAGILVFGDSDGGQFSSFQKTEPDYLDKRKVNVQRAAVPRTRPAFKDGWELSFVIEIMASDHINVDMLHRALSDAGRFNGLGDYRPDFGRFRIDTFEILQDVVETSKSTKVKPS